MKKLFLALILVGALVTFPKVSFCAEANLQTENACQASNQDKDTFFIAAIKGDLPTIQRLLTSQSNIINVTNEFGLTALMLASSNGHSEVVDTLIGAGTDVNTADKNGMTAVILASANGCLEVVMDLIQAGANVNVTLPNKRTALTFAHRYPKVVDALIQAR